jgi:sugar phosphate isomerase/epimerase
MTTRRQFFQRISFGAAASLVAGGGWAKDPAPSGEQSAKPPAKRTFELGLASYTFRNFPLDKCLAMTARVGLKHICLKDIHLPRHSTPAKIAQVVARVKAAGIDLYGGGVIEMGNAAEVERAFAYAKAAGMRTIVGVPLPTVLPLVDEKVKKYDIRVAIHNHGPGDRVYPTPAVAYERIKNLDRRIGLCIDIGHAARAGLDPSQPAEQFADRLFDVHMKDETAATPKGVCIEAGRGVIDLPKFLRTLDRIGYAGFVSFEFEKDPADPLPGLAESVGYVRGILAVI